MTHAITLELNDEIEIEGDCVRHGLYGMSLSVTGIRVLFRGIDVTKAFSEREIEHFGRELADSFLNEERERAV